MFNRNLFINGNLISYQDFQKKAVAEGYRFDKSESKTYQAKYIDDCSKLFMDEFDQMDHSNGEMFQHYVVEESLFAKQALLKHSSTQSQLPKNANTCSMKKGFFNKK